MGYIVFASIMLLAILVGVVIALFGKTTDYGTNVRVVGVAVLSVALLLLGVVTAAVSVTTVGARSVAVETSFGKYQGTLDNGLHWIAPWASTQEFSTQVQYLHLEDNNTVNVTYQGGGSGTVAATVRWRIAEDGAQALWQKYRTFDNVRDNLVTQASRTSFREVIGNYQPAEAIAGENLEAIASGVEDNLDKALAVDGVVIDSVSISHVALDPNAQRGLDQIVKANADVQRAKIEQERAIIDAKTAEIREKSGSLSPGALSRYCLEVINIWDANKNGPLPAGFNCFSGSNVAVLGK